MSGAKPPDWTTHLPGFYHGTQKAKKKKVTAFKPTQDCMFCKVLLNNPAEVC